MKTNRAPFVDRRGRIQHTLSMLDELILITDDCKQDIDLHRHLANYATLRVSGALEYCLSEAIKIYLGRCGDQALARFVEQSTSRLMNLDSAKIESLFRKFSDEWAEAVRDFLEVDENRQRLNALVGKRNTLAHGGSTTVSMRDVYAYRSLVGDLINVVLSVVDPKNT